MFVLLVRGMPFCCHLTIANWYLNLRVLRLRACVVVHLSGPLQKTSQLLSFPDHEAPEFQKADLVHLQAGISFHAPAQVRAAPWR
jgi:hypothetical protein